MGTDPVAPGLVDARGELGQVVAPGRRPQRGLDRRRERLVCSRGASEVPERRGDLVRRQAECGAEAPGIGGGPEVRRFLRPLDAEALLAAAIAAGIARPLVGAVVRWRAGRQEGQPVGVVVDVEQGRQPLRPGIGRVLTHPDDEQDVDRRRLDRLGQHEPDGHADRLGPFEVDHPPHTVVDSQRRRIVASGGERLVRIGPDGELCDDVPAGRHRDHPAVPIGRGRPARREAGGPRGAHVRSRLAEVGEPRLAGDGVFLPDGRRRAVRGVAPAASAERSRRPGPRRSGR